MWNDRDIPLAYLITFRCYGTWLPGDERGTIDRLHNQYKKPYKQPNDLLLKHSQKRLKNKPFNLNSESCEIIESAIREVCDYRKRLLHAINLRTNHVHLVVSVGETNPSKALNSFKSYATRRLREKNIWSFEHSPWASRGSRKHLWNEKHLEIAVDYVINGQGNELLEFD